MNFFGNLFKKKGAVIGRVELSNPRDLAEPREWIIPDSEMADVAQLVDELAEGGNEGRYNLWSKLHSIFPETIDVPVRLNTNHACRYKIEEICRVK